MSIDDKTRREILQYSYVTGSVAVGAALAGCIGGSDDGDSDGSDGSDGGSDGDKVEEWKQKAKEEENGEFKFMHAMAGESATGFIEAVEEEFPWMNINGVKGSENIGTRFISEYQSGSPTIDAVWYEDVLTLHNEDMVIDLTQLPNYAALPENAKGGDYWAPFKFLTYTTLYNTEQMDNPPESWGDLTKSEYKGELLMSQSPKFSVLKWIKENVDEEWIDKMAEQDVQLASGHGQAIKQVAAGARGAMPGAFMKYLFIEDRTGETPVEAVPFDKVLLLPTPLGISDEAPHPNTAKFFTNWLFSDDGMETLAGNLKQSCMGTADNLLCNPDGLQEVARQPEPVLLEQLGPDEREEIAQEWKNKMGI